MNVRDASQEVSLRRLRAKQTRKLQATVFEAKCQVRPMLLLVKQIRYFGLLWKRTLQYFKQRSKTSDKFD
jgi:hypothetical protein